jgi:uncharacterized membrane protein SirB2
MFACLLFLCVYLAYSLIADLLDQGCVVWHRNALGYYTQLIVCFVCLLILSIDLKVFIRTRFTLEKQLDTSIMPRFTSLLILAGLYLFKIFIFKMKNLIYHLVMLGSIVVGTITFESHYDEDPQKASPLFLTAVPIACILIA